MIFAVFMLMLFLVRLSTVVATLGLASTACLFLSFTFLPRLLWSAVFSCPNVCPIDVFPDRNLIKIPNKILSRILQEMFVRSYKKTCKKSARNLQETGKKLARNLQEKCKKNTRNLQGKMQETCKKNPRNQGLYNIQYK